MGDQKVRISEEVYSQLKAIADKIGKSMKELAEEAITAYLLGREGAEGKEIKGITAKIIQLQYPAKCRKCGKQLNPGDLAYWVKVTYTDNSVRSYVICLDCYYQSTALKEYYIKKKQLEAIIRGLRKEADELAEKVTELRQYRDLIKVRDEILKLFKEARELYQVLINPVTKEQALKLAQAVENLYDETEKLRELLDRMEEEMEKKAKKRKARARVREW